jgi:hypothetical protein
MHTTRYLQWLTHTVFPKREISMQFQRKGNSCTLDETMTLKRQNNLLSLLFKQSGEILQCWRVRWWVTNVAIFTLLLWALTTKREVKKQSLLIQTSGRDTSPVCLRTVSYWLQNSPSSGLIGDTWPACLDWQAGKCTSYYHTHSYPGSWGEGGCGVTR